MELTDGMYLYHGSYTAVEFIDLSKCEKGLDFGKGFYLTSSYEQAYQFVKLSVRKAVKFGNVPEDFDISNGKISVYKYHKDPNVLTYCFDGSNAEWLHFVAGNRKNGLFDKLLKKFEPVDIIGGKIADDQTARTLQRYTAGDFGQPGTLEADIETVRRLLPNRLEDQFCFRINDAISCLEFVRSDTYGEISI